MSRVKLNRVLAYYRVLAFLGAVGLNSIEFWPECNRENSLEFHPITLRKAKILRSLKFNPIALRKAKILGVLAFLSVIGSNSLKFWPF